MLTRNAVLFGIVSWLVASCAMFCLATLMGGDSLNSMGLADFAKGVGLYALFVGPVVGLVTLVLASGAPTAFEGARRVQLPIWAAVSGGAAGLAFDLMDTPPFHPFLVAPGAVSGVIGGTFGVAAILANEALSRNRKKSPRPHDQRQSA